ncbi:hypothetical protein GGR57DRAFT_456180 [Xylariaceae sp. FL1272]|nr:hypothetical protein GGR57DRAFT_456180 [Xylariaceae sp. FL1272]
MSSRKQARARTVSQYPSCEPLSILLSSTMNLLFCYEALRILTSPTCIAPGLKVNATPAFTNLFQGHGGYSLRPGENTPMTPVMPTIPRFGGTPAGVPVGPSYGSGLSATPLGTNSSPFGPRSSSMIAHPGGSRHRDSGLLLPVKDEPIGSPLALDTPAAHNQGGSDGHRGGQKGSKQHVQPIERLSLECQKRGFNLQWLERSIGEDLYECDVKLFNDLVKGEERCLNPLIAKQRCAIKALDFLKGVGVPRPIQALRELKRMSASIPPKAGSIAPGTGASSWEPASSSTARHTTRDDPRDLIQRIQATFGGSAPNLTDLGNEAYARAYLQGIATGVAIQQASVGAGQSINNAADTRRPATAAPSSSSKGYKGKGTYHDRRAQYDRRERSPSGDRNRRYRDRSTPNRRR